MATKKSKSSNKSKKSNSTKPVAERSTAKSAAKTAAKTELEAPKTKKVEEKTTSEKPKSFLSGFFARKYEEKESILTIFKNHKFYGALLGEVLGTLLIT